MSFDLHILKNEMKQMIKRLKSDKALNVSNFSNKVLQTDLAELILTLMNLFNTCITLEYHLKQFKKTQTIVFYKSKKSNYINSKMY